MTTASAQHRLARWLTREPQRGADRVRGWMNPRLREQLREEAMIEQDVRAIEHALSDVRVLSHDALADRCNAAHWQPGHFQRALQRALEHGRIHRVGDRFYGLGPEPMTTSAGTPDAGADDAGAASGPPTAG